MSDNKFLQHRFYTVGPRLRSPLLQKSGGRYKGWRY
jgi:hypothetical protein